LTGRTARHSLLKKSSWEGQMKFTTHSTMRLFAVAALALANAPVP
jgi:hypothetical protein